MSDKSPLGYESESFFIENRLREIFSASVRFLDAQKFHEYIQEVNVLDEIRHLFKRYEEIRRDMRVRNQ